jgi:hypothetical protein
MQELRIVQRGSSKGIAVRGDRAFGTPLCLGPGRNPWQIHAQGARWEVLIPNRSGRDLGSSHDLFVDLAVIIACVLFGKEERTGSVGLKLESDKAMQNVSAGRDRLWLFSRRKGP